VKKKVSSVGIAALKLSKCGLRYLASYMLPFSPEAVGVCVPQNSTTPSQKVHTNSRFDITSTGNNIWLNVIPSLAQDSAIAMYTTQTLNDELLSADDTLAPGVVVVQQGTNPYAMSSYTQYDADGAQGISGRIVAVGVRVSYTGTTMQQGGLMYCYTSPKHDNVSLLPGKDIANTPAGIGAFVDTEIHPVSRDFCEFSIIATSDRERNFGDQNGTAPSDKTVIYPFSGGKDDLAGVGGYTYTYSFNGVPVCAPVACVLISGLPTGQTVHVEIITHFEVAGFFTSSTSTLNSAHPEDMGKIATVVGLIPSLRASMPTMDKWSLLKMAASTAAKIAVTYALPAAETALMGLLL
jgi:hypothetical protein